jgi:hypothetical protein
VRIILVFPSERNQLGRRSTCKKRSPFSHSTQLFLRQEVREERRQGAGQRSRVFPQSARRCSEGQAKNRKATRLAICLIEAERVEITRSPDMPAKSASCSCVISELSLARLRCAPISRTVSDLESIMIPIRFMSSIIDTQRYLYRRESTRPVPPVTVFTARLSNWGMTA